MKKIIALAFFASLFVGCSSSSDNESNSNSKVYDIELTIKTGDNERKYVDVYSYNDYDFGQYSFQKPIIANYSGNFYLENGYVYGISDTGVLNGLIPELYLELGQNLTNGQVITFSPNSVNGINRVFSLNFGGINEYGYYFNNVNSNGQIKITGNQNNKLAGEFTFNNISNYSSTGTTDNAIVSGKFKNMPIQ
jgi:hypothetical protein